MVYSFFLKFKDEWGEIWVKPYPFSHIVIRVSDECIGGWFNGNGLTRI